jgi:hypothetical protein
VFKLYTTIEIPLILLIFLNPEDSSENTIGNYLTNLKSLSTSYI